MLSDNSSVVYTRIYLDFPSRDGADACPTHHCLQFTKPSCILTCLRPTPRVQQGKLYRFHFTNEETGSEWLSCRKLLIISSWDLDPAVLVLIPNLGSGNPDLSACEKRVILDDTFLAPTLASVMFSFPRISRVVSFL